MGTQPNMPEPGWVVGLFTAERAGEPMQAHQTVELVPGLGIPGDRYATKQGFWSDPQWPDQELTLLAAEVADEVGIDAGLLRRNVVTRGVRLPGLIGVTFLMGTAVIEGVRPCDPCGHIQTLTGRAGIYKALNEHGGGLRARIVHGGRVSVGDAIVVLSSTATVP